MYTLKGAVNLTRDRKGGFRESAIEVFKEWGFPDPEKILVSAHKLENDISASNTDSIVDAVEKNCIAFKQRYDHARNPNHRRLPAAQLGPASTSQTEPPPKTGQLDLGI